MAQSPYLVREPPNAENTVRVSDRPDYLFGWSSIYEYELFGGGTNYTVEVVQVPPQSVELDRHIQNLSGSPVSIYVLRQFLVIWMHRECIGINIPYPLVALHAVKEVDHRPMLYLQLLSCELFRSVGPQSDEDIPTVELVIYQEGNGRNLMLLKDDCSIQELYDAMSTCSGFHVDKGPEIDYDDRKDSYQMNRKMFPPFETPSEWLNRLEAPLNSDSEGSLNEFWQRPKQTRRPGVWLNWSVADDLEDFHQVEEEDDGEAGMNVSLVSGQIAGVTRRRSSGSERLKIRRLR